MDLRTQCSGFRCRNPKFYCKQTQVTGESLNDREIEILLRAIIDPYSQASFVLGSLCKRLKLQIEIDNMPNEGTGTSFWECRN